MEIITYVISGQLEHQDSMGNGSIIRAGEFQRMSAGTGITHSEFNPSKSELVHLYQIWIEPSQRGIPPSYEQKMFSPDQKRNQLCLVASQEGKLGSLKINSEVNLYIAQVDREADLKCSCSPDRSSWIQVLSG